MAAPVAAGERIGDLLIREGVITKEQLQQALREQKENGTRIGYNLVKLGFIQETELTKMLARQYKMPAVDLSRFELDPKIAKLVPTDLAVKHLVVPLKRDGRTLTVAMADPTNLGVLDDLKFITRYDIFPVIAGEFTLRSVIEKHYGTNDEQQMASLMQDLEEESDVEVVEEEDDAGAAMQAQMDDAPVVKLINAILTDAVKRGASDIHFECFEFDLRVRYRIDGALLEVMKPPLKMKAALISRFKIMASLNIAERRVPQDGRIKLKMGNKVIDYRVSSLPTLFGEKIVLRILNKDNLTLDLQKFGIEPKAEQDLLEAISNPYGMVLVTGPTGSGKTTTLYSALSQINTIDTNIMTAEDPVEYNLYGINQVQVRNEIGMTFAAALKAFLRQDPNIIMVGEIRDLETGGIAIKAALTGHLVLSTLHTNSAIGAIPRLLDLGTSSLPEGPNESLLRFKRHLGGVAGLRADPQARRQQLGAPVRELPCGPLRALVGVLGRRRAVVGDHRAGVVEHATLRAPGEDQVGGALGLARSGLAAAAIATGEAEGDGEDQHREGDKKDGEPGCGAVHCLVTLFESKRLSILHRS